MITLKAYGADTERLRICAEVLKAMGESFNGSAKDKVLGEISAICDKREAEKK